MNRFYQETYGKAPMTMDELRMHIQLLLSPCTHCNSLLNLFHYTTAYAKEQIICEDGIHFRFSKASDFLDKNEGIHILEPFYHTLGTLYNNGEINKDIYENLKNINKSDICDNNQRTWILCFSENGNSKYMKERYAPKDGYVIGISFEHLVRQYDEIVKDYDMEIIKVEYSHETIKDTLIMVIKLLYESYNHEAKIAPQYISELSLKLKEAVALALSRYSYIYKSSEYAEEQEIRLVFKASDDSLNELPKEKKEGLYYNGKNNLFLGIHPTALYYCNHKLSVCNDFRLNKPKIHSQEIKNVFNQH